MPDDRLPIETDGDPQTVYEDTSPHQRTGFMPEQPDVTALPSNEESLERMRKVWSESETTRPRSNFARTATSPVAVFLFSI
ncbi:hypothetical protein ABEO75_04205 [Paenibacillus macerans]|uniref:hypothetical protein n=1 Tax=Paenibacillus macerans TaxID=44252 RepID=UPI002E1DA9BF|nr:hypothetical protein [Paenibacillus macerans]